MTVNDEVWKKCKERRGKSVANFSNKKKYMILLVIKEEGLNI